MERRTGRDFAKGDVPAKGTRRATARIADTPGLDRASEDTALLRQALDESRRRFNDISELGADWIWETDAEHRLTFVSPAGLRAFQLTERQLYGLPRKEVARLRPIVTTRETHRRHLQDLKARRDFTDFEFAITRPDGSLTHVQASAKAIRDAHGRFTGYRGFAKDITAWREAADRLAASEQRFQDFALSAADRFWETDANHRLTYVSDAEAHSSMLPAAELLGRPLWDAPAPAGQADRWRQRRAIIEDQLPFRDFRIQQFGPKDVVLHLRVSGRPVYDQRHEFVGHRGTIVDETAEVVARRVADRAEQMFLQALDTMRDAVVLFDADDLFVLCNRVYRERLKEIENLLVPGTPVEALIHAAIQSGRMSKTEESEEDWTRRILNEHRRRAGGPERQLRDGRWERVDRYPTPEGGVLVVHTDITRQVEAANALRASEQRARAFLDATSDYAVLVDTDFVIADINQDMADRFGKPAAELIGTPLADQMDAHVVEHRLSYLRQVIATGEAAAFSDYHRGRWVETRYTPIATDGGEVTHVAIFARDVTAEKLAESALRLAKEEAEEASRAKSRFLGNISHELRTPLNAIIGFAEFMEAEMYGPLGHEKYHEYVTDISKSAQHVVEVIGDLLDISAIEQGRMTLEEGEIDPAACADAAIRLVAVRARAKQITIASDFEARVPLLRADDRRLKQVLLNVLINAIKFTPRGGAIHLAGAPAANGGYALEITDTGVGMTADEIETALTPFGRVANGGMERSEGTGLGLPVSASIMEAHGGRLDMTSAPGEGTRVVLTIPPARVISGEPA